MTNPAGNYLVAAFCLWFAACSFWHAVETCAGSEWRLMHGHIVDYEMVPQFPPIPWPRTPRHAVEFEDRGERLTVHATSAFVLFSLVPQRVSFWYSGDPQRDVRLLETANPATVGVVFVALAVLSLAFVQGQKMRQWIGL